MKAVLIYLLCLITIGCFSQQSQVVVYELYFNGGLVETFYSKAELYKFIDREKEKHRIDDNPFWGSLNNSIYKQYMEKFKVKMRRGDGVVLDLGDVMNFNPYKQELDALKEQEHEFDYDSLLDDIPLRLSTERKQGRINSTKLNDLSNLSDMSTPALENCAILSSCYENIIDTVWIDYAVKNTCDDLRDSASGYLGWDSKKIESYLIEAYKGLSGEECFDKIISLDTTSLSESEKVVCMEYNEFARRVFTKLEEIKKRPKVLDNQLAEGDSFKDVKILAQIDPQSSLWGDPRISSDFAPIDADLLFTEYKKREMEASKIEQTDSDLWGEIVEGMTAQRFSSVIGSLMVYNNDRLPKFLCMSKDGESYVFTNKDTTMIFGVQRDGSSVIFASFEENELSKHNFIADIRNLKVPGEVSANFETLGVKYSYSWNGTEQEGEISSKEEVGENAPRSVEQKTSVGVKSDGISYQHCVKEKYTFNKKAKKSDKEKPLFEAKVEGKLNGMDNTSTLKYHKVLISRGGILALGGIEGSAGGKISVKGSIGFSTKVDEDNKRLSGASINVGGETLRLRGELGGGWSTEHSLYLVGADVSAALSYGLKVKAGNEIEASFPFLGVGGRLRVVDLEKGFQQTGNNYIISNFGR